MVYQGLLPNLQRKSTPERLASGVISGASKASDFAQKMMLKSQENPYRQAQQARLAADSLLKQYSTRLKEQMAILESPYSKKEERTAAQDLIKRLREERDTLFGWAQSPEMGNQETEIPSMEGMEEKPPEIVEPIKTKKRKKVKFDTKNKEHVAKYNQLFKSYNGDKNKINEALSREFE